MVECLDPIGIDQAIFKGFAEILKSLNNDETIIAAFLDLSKAFDCIDVSLLIT